MTSPTVKSSKKLPPRVLGVMRNYAFVAFTSLTANHLSPNT